MLCYDPPNYPQRRTLRRMEDLDEDRSVHYGGYQPDDHGAFHVRHQTGTGNSNQQGYINTNTINVNSNNNNNNNVYRRNRPVVVESPTHPARCPPLDVQFLWRLYNQRNGENNQFHRNRNPSVEERLSILKSQGFPLGLARLILQHSKDHPVRIWLVDNCGTMHRNDGHIVSQSTSGKVNVVDCTRWEEVTSTIQWHAELAAWCQSPMAVRLFQDPGVQVGPQQLGVSASKRYSSKEEVERLRALLKKTRPIGATSPLHYHLQELFPGIAGMVPMLKQTSKKFVLCVCTDSIPTDIDGREDPAMIQDCLLTLQQLIDWPVQVVLRLSTDEERVVQFFRNVKANNRDFEERLQIVDDYVSECKQVQENNPWLHYGYPLHLCREEGIMVPVLEALSQRPVKIPTELCEVLGLIFGQMFVVGGTGGGGYQYTTDVFKNYPAFRKQVEEWNNQAGVLWNPIKRKFVPWVNLKKLDKICQKMMKDNTSHDGEKCTIM